MTGQNTTGEAHTAEELMRPTFLRVRRRYDSDSGDEGDILGWGMQFPSGVIVMDWDRTAYPPEDRLRCPHVSQYGCRRDLNEATGGSVEIVESFDLYPLQGGR